MTKHTRHSAFEHCAVAVIAPTAQPIDGSRVEPVSEHASEIYRFEVDDEVTGVSTVQTYVFSNGHQLLLPWSDLIPWGSLPEIGVPVFHVPLGAVDNIRLLASTQNEWDEWRSSIVAAAFPGQAYASHQATFVYYFEPTDDRFDCGSSRLQVREAVLRLRDCLGETGSGLIPQLFGDLIVLHGVDKTGGNKCVCVRRRPLPKRQMHGLYLARSFVAVTTMLGIRQSLLMNADRISSMEKAWITERAQLATLPTVVQPSLRLGRARDNTAENAYERHLSTRAERIALRHDVMASLKAYRKELPVFSSYRTDDNWLWTSEEVSQGKHRLGVLARYEMGLSQTADDLDARIATLATREELTDALFRDYLNASVAASNLDLQRSVRRLTVIAVVAAILPVAIDLLKGPINQLFTYLQRHWAR